jgi:transcriptional regulator with GAF, ATPase, and Fis domain
MERVELVAGSDIAVLIIGETGSGKEVIARAIHERSKRADKPFIRVNCGAISPELIDSELFGHEKGAFTGATATRRGWFERADGGTLLLDEVGELPLPAQVRLLRVLQEGTFERVGGERSLHVDVRIVAATHRDLPGMVQERRFREDLWYRITGFQLLIPPLRERREDIPGLARHFVERACRRFGTRPLTLEPDHLALLTIYPWPGNVRELASVIDRAAILGEGRTLEVARALGGGVALERGSADPGTAPVPPAVGPAGTGGRIPTLDQAMRGHIEAALAATGGRIEGRHGAARVLGINPHTLRARMRKLGIEWGRFREGAGAAD